MRKYIPLLLMLTAGAITAIITWIMEYSFLGRLVALFVVLVIFYVVGRIMVLILDSYERDYQARERARKEAEEAAAAEEAAKAEEEAKESNKEIDE